jgi:hypothetical protein
MLVIMAKRTGFFTRALGQTLTVIERMASPEGTAIGELTCRLQLNRRSVFRILETIEHRLLIPLTVRRETFGGAASYHLPASFIQNLSDITLPPMSLTFRQALLIYLLIQDNAFPKENDCFEDVTVFCNTLKSLFEPFMASK